MWKGSMTNPYWKLNNNKLDPTLSQLFSKKKNHWIRPMESGSRLKGVQQLKYKIIYMK